MENLQLVSGSLFGNRFEIQCAAGSGGMGTVYRAKDRHSGDTVGVKLLHAGGGGADEAERFTREAQLLSELRHPGIVSYVAHGQTPDGQRFLAMEWLDGNDLGQRLARGPLPVRESLRLLEQVAAALSVAHQRGIIHRDLKPSNLFLVGEDLSRVKLIDFGIARRLGTSKVMTRTGVLVGTPEYMAPEQARGCRTLTPATDMFALGCILYECLTGQPPFVADHIAAVLVKILFEEPAPIEEVLPTISPSLSSLLARLLVKDPEQRVADAAALHAELLALGELPEPALALTMASQPSKTERFAETEQSLFSVVLAASAEEDLALGATQPGGASLLGGRQRQALLQELASLGGSPDFLINGTLIVTVPPLGSAQDQATLAARSALHIRERWPEAVVSMAMGRGRVRGRTAVGEVVEMAARALTTGSQPSSSYARSGVIVDSLSAKLLEGRFAQTHLAAGALLLGEEYEADKSRPLLGQPTPCVGREVELSLLEAQLEGCIEESEARVILITAPPGVGKSRLRHEFLRRLGQRSDAVTVLKGRGDLMSAGAAYGILGQMIRRLCGISDGEPQAAQQHQLRTRIARHLPVAAAERCILFIGELCGIPFPDAEQPILIAARRDARIMHDQMRQAFLDWLRAECGAAPLLLLLDDLQWGDALSIGLVDEVLRELRSSPLLLLALARPEVHEQFPKLWQAHHPQHIPLKGLSKKAGERLIRHVLGPQVDSALAARLLEQAGGNALFLEELIRSVGEGKHDDQPDTVLAMLQARIGRLDAGVRRSILAASVYGPTVWLGGIAAILGRDAADQELERQISILTEREVLEPHSVSRLSNQKEFGFRHVLLREAAYSLLSDTDRMTGHRTAGEFLASQGEPNPALIAEHFERGGERLRAAVFYARAAESALDHFASVDALSYVEAGIACASDQDSATLWCLRGLECSARMSLGQLVRSFEGGIVALPNLRAGSPLWCRTMEALILGAALGPPDLKQQLPGLAGRLLGTEPEPGAEEVYCSALSFLTSGASIAAPILQAQMISERLRVVSERAADRNPTIMRFYGWGYGHFRHHRVPKPWSILQEAEATVKLCRQAGDLRMLTFVLLSEVALTWAELGDLDRAVQAVEEAAQAAHKTQDGVARGLSGIFRESLRIETEALSDVPASVSVARDEMQVMGTASLFAVSALDLQARGWLRLGEPSEAETALRQAEGTAQTIPAYEPAWRATLMRILRAKGELPEAVREAERALQLLAELECLGNAEVEVRLAACEVFHSAGQTERARNELTATLQQIALRSQDIAEPFWKSSYLGRNPHCVRAQQLAKEWGVDALVT